MEDSNECKIDLDHISLKTPNKFRRNEKSSLFRNNGYLHNKSAKCLRNEYSEIFKNYKEN